MENKLQIEQFSDKYKEDFVKINIEWLERLFAVEQHDVDVLERCEENIIRKGGFIFIGRIGSLCIATIAFMKVEEGVFEVGKMAVVPEYQGQKIGQQMLDHGLQFGMRHGWKKAVIYTVRSLENALHIYKKFGFQEVDLEPNNPYIRADMKLILHI